MKYARTVELAVPYQLAVLRVKEALKEVGFGTLTEIDVQATLREKLGEEMEPYLIIGACNPQLAHRVLEIERDIGLLLPCNVVVRQLGTGTLVQVLDPEVMAQIPGRPELQPIAEEAGARIDRALAALRSWASGEAGPKT